MKKIVITGATGFLGVHLIEEWLKESCEIYAVVRPNSKNINRLPEDSRIHIIEKEMPEYDCLNEDIKEADYFYHLAWEGIRAPLRDDKDIQKRNYACAVKAYESAVKMKCTFFLGSGSQAEYGITNGLVDENYPCSPSTEYGKEKLHAFQTLSERSKESTIHFIWIRIFSIYGKYDYTQSLIMTAVNKMMKNELIDLTSCTQLWDFLNVDDAAKAMKLFAISDCADGVYNLASGDYKPLREFVEIIKEVTKSTSKLMFGTVEYGANGPVNLMPDVSKIKMNLKWNPKIEFKDGITDLIYTGMTSALK